MLIGRVEARNVHLVLFNERFAATCGCGGLGVGVVLDLRFWGLELGGLFNDDGGFEDAFPAESALEMWMKELQNSRLPVFADRFLLAG